jgi:hypothetical protein
MRRRAHTNTEKLLSGLIEPLREKKPRLSAGPVRGRWKESGSRSW